MASTITKDDLERMMEDLDADGNGTVTKDEFKVAYLKVFNKMTDKDFETQWKKIDADNSGSLSLEELAKYYGFSLSALSRGGKGDDEMSDEQILEALQMQTALAELEAEAKAKRENSPSNQKAMEPKVNRRGSAGTVEARKKNSSGVVTVKMPSKTTFEITDPNILFLQACDLGDCADISKRITDGANVRIEDDKGEMPLHKLARTGSIDAVRKVLEATETAGCLKADINWQDKQGKSPIFYAAEFKKIEVVTLFLDRGAEPLLENNNGWTVLHAAANSNDEKICGAILLHQFVDKKAQLNYVDRQGRTALHIAAFKAHENIVEFFLQHGADAACTDTAGNSASNLAKKSGRRKSKDLLDAALPQQPA